MEIIDKSVKRQYIADMQDNFFGDMVKGVVDIEKCLLAVDAELHADLERILLENGSQQFDLWGINLYPELDDEDFLEFDSMINIRPSQDNPSRDVLNPETRERIKSVINKLIV